MNVLLNGSDDERFDRGGGHAPNRTGLLGLPMEKSGGDIVPVSHTSTLRMTGRHAVATVIEDPTDQQSL